MLRHTDDGVNVPASRTARRVTIAVFLALALPATGMRGPAWQMFAAAPVATEKPAAAEGAPFDLSLVLGQDKEADGVYGIRPAALLNRPALEPVRKSLNKWIDRFTRELRKGGVGIHVEDVEQLMGRVYFKGENKVGKRSLLMSINVLRTNKGMDWARLREECGTKIEKYQWKGDTYISIHMLSALISLTGATDDVYLWAADARTLVLHDEDTIKNLIEAKLAGKKPAAPDYAASWDRVSRHLLAVALDNRGGRLVKRTVTEAEANESLSDPKKAEYYLARFYQKASRVVAGFAGNDNFLFDVHATADTPADAAALVEYCKGVLATSKSLTEEEKTKTETSDGLTVANLAFLRRVLARASVRVEGTGVTVHGDVETGLNAVLAQYAREMARAKK
jgi:hypothetical protein